MAGTIFDKGNTICDCGQPMAALHLITSGKVEVTYPGGTYQLGKGDVIGICEICSEVHLLRYTALTDINVFTYPLTNLDTLEDLLQKNPDIARLFLLSCFRQINTLQSRSSISEMHCSNLYRNLLADYRTFHTLCLRYDLSLRKLEHLEELNAYIEDETPDLWLNGYYVGLTRIYASENCKLLLQEAAISIGMLRKGSLDFRKTYLSIEEQYQYLQQLTDFYFNAEGNDLFDFYTSLYYRIEQNSEDARQILKTVERMIEQTKDIAVSAPDLRSRRIQSFQSSIAALTGDSASPENSSADSKALKELAGSLNTILDFAGPAFTEASSFRQHINAYKTLPDCTALDSECDALRKILTKEFYALYTVIFERTLKVQSIPLPVRMFLYFGYVDEMLAGEQYAISLYHYACNIKNATGSGVYTFYDWLLAIYRGKKEPSRNEFDQDYTEYLHKQKQGGYLTEEQVKEMESSPMAKVHYELTNMFPQVNKISFGRLSTFCPVFSAGHVLKDLESSYVTAEQIHNTIAEIKRIDYSAFYRESLDMDNISTLGKEILHFEYLPDVILMPNVGIRGVMWQEIEGKRRNSPGRMIFSIFHMEDIKTSFIRMTGEFRWELCKRIQGVHWNNVAESSLTSEYFDYVQFYKKNHELTADAKEKVRTSLQRAKNSFKEMFVRDYLIWILFEGNSSPKLNKVARRILFTYCPFSAEVCKSLEQNPLYNDLLHTRHVRSAQRIHHLNLLTQKLRNSNTPIPDSLAQELIFAGGSTQPANPSF